VASSLSTPKGRNIPEKGQMSTIYKAIGDKIRELRTGRPELSQEKLAAALGTTANTVSRWETAQYRPSVGDLEKISRFFGVPITVFFPDMAADAKLQALLSATGDLDSDDLEEIVRYAQFRRARRHMTK
jgi:transcriptional regulator with XRE-family HTH domain